MGAGFHDFPVVQHQDLAGILDGREPVGDDKGGPPHHEPVQGFLDDPFAFRIQGGSGFVQDQDPGILQESPGYGDALALAAGHVDAPIPQIGIISLGQVPDEFICIGSFGRCHHFLPGGIQPSVEDVVVHRIIEQIGFLRHDSHLFPEGSHGHIPDIVVIDQDGSFCHIIEPGQQVGDGGFACTAGAHQGNGLAGLGGERQMLQDGFIRIVGEGYIPEFHFPFHRRQDDGIGLFRDLFIQVQDAEHPVRSGQCPLDVPQHPGDPLDGVGDVHRVDQKGNQRPGGDIAAEDPPAPEPDDGGDPQGRDEFDHWREGAHEPDTFHVGIEVFPVGPFEPGDLIRFPDEGLHHTAGGKGFLEHGSDVGSGLLDPMAGLADLLAEEIHEEQHHREGAEGEQGQLPIQVDHGADGADKDGSLRDDFHRVVHHGALHGLDVIGHITHDGAQFIGIIEPGIQFHHFFEHQAPDIDDHAFAHIVHQIVLSVVGNASSKEDHHDAQGDQVQQLGVIVDEYLVDHVPDDPGDIQVGSRGEHGADPCQGQPGQIGFDEAQDSQIQVHGFSFAVSRISSAVRSTAPGCPNLATACRISSRTAEAASGSRKWRMEAAI